MGLVQAAGHTAMQSLQLEAALLWEGRGQRVRETGGREGAGARGPRGWGLDFILGAMEARQGV